MSAEYDSAWYGTFKVTLDTPVPTGDSSYWPPDIYVSRSLFLLRSSNVWFADTTKRIRCLGAD